MALGPLDGGLIIGIYGRIIGVRIAFGVAFLLGLVAFLLGLVALYLQWRFMSDDIVAKEVECVSIKNFREYFRPKLINLLVSDILIRFAEQIPYAFVIRGLKEVGEPTRKALIMDLARDDAKARTFGTYYLFRDVIVSVAALSSAFLWNISPATNFVTAFAFGVLGDNLICGLWKR